LYLFSLKLGLGSFTWRWKCQCFSRSSYHLCKTYWLLCESF